MSGYRYDYPRPAVTVDVAAFCLDGDAPRLLLVQRARPPHEGDWALPGGFMDIDEELEDAARREFAEETGLAVDELTQMHTAGTIGRDPRGRTISVVFLAYLPEAHPPTADDDAADARWFDVTELPTLAFDHADLVAMAFEHARRHYGVETRGATP